MKILTVLTYYRPHTSGLTIYAERLALAFARRGHHVTVMTSQYDKSLPGDEFINGIHVVRVPVAFRISKGVISPTFGKIATKLVKNNDVVQLHLPQFDAPGVALRGRLFGKPVILTYHCDLHLPPGGFNRLVNTVVKVQNNLAALLADHLVTYTQDYADHSTFLTRYKGKLTPLLPPVALPQIDPAEIETFRSAYRTEGWGPVIGMVTRLAAEKGVEVLLEALPKVLEKYPRAQVLFAGQYQDVMGERAYAERLLPLIKRYEEGGYWKFLGNLSQTQLAAFYPNLNVLVVPSLNSTEAFGLVQVEAMMNNIPCVASDLPGVRRPVQMHGMGKVTRVGDSSALADALLDVFAKKPGFQCDTEELKHLYEPDTVAGEYEVLFKKLMLNK